MKYICLDIGNVLCHVDTLHFIDELSYTVNITLSEASRFMRRFQQIHDLGYTTIEDELKDKFNIKSQVTLSKLIATWNSSVVPCDLMISKLNELCNNHNLQIALLSNIGIEHAAMMEHTLKAGGFFSGAIKHFSCEVGARKPSKLFYQSFLWEHPQFKGCLYVDDLVENLQASKQFGFETFFMSLEENNTEYSLEDKINEIEKIIIAQELPANSRWH